MEYSVIRREEDGSTEHGYELSVNDCISLSSWKAGLWGRKAGQWLLGLTVEAVVPTGAWGHAQAMEPFCVDLRWWPSHSTNFSRSIENSVFEVSFSSVINRTIFGGKFPLKSN